MDHTYTVGVYYPKVTSLDLSGVALTLKSIQALTKKYDVKLRIISNLYLLSAHAKYSVCVHACVHTLQCVYALCICLCGLFLCVYVFMCAFMCKATIRLALDICMVLLTTTV